MSRSRSKGERHASFEELWPNNAVYTGLLYYLYYRMKYSVFVRKLRGMGQVKDCIRRIGLSIRNHFFTWEDLILVLDYLVSFAEEADVVGMNERQAFAALSYGLGGLAEYQFKSIRGSLQLSDGGLPCWAEAVQYLRWSYATGNAIH